MPNTTLTDACEMDTLIKLCQSGGWRGRGMCGVMCILTFSFWMKVARKRPFLKSCSEKMSGFFFGIAIVEPLDSPNRFCTTVDWLVCSTCRREEKPLFPPILRMITLRLSTVTYYPFVILFAVIVLVYLLRSSTISCSRCSQPFGFMLAHPCKRLGIGINYEFVPSGVDAFTAPGTVVGLMAPPSHRSVKWFRG